MQQSPFRGPLLLLWWGLYSRDKKKKKKEKDRQKDGKKIIFIKKNLSSNLLPKNANITWLCTEDFWLYQLLTPPSLYDVLKLQATLTCFRWMTFLQPPTPSTFLMALSLLYFYIYQLDIQPPKSIIYNNQNIIQIATNMLCYLQKSHQLQNWLSFKWPAVSGSSLLAQKDLLWLWWASGERQLLGCLDFTIKILNEESSQCLFKNPWKQTTDLSITGITPGNPHAP